MAKHPGGRPTDYNPEIAAEICSRISTSSDGLVKICEPDNFPSPSTVYLWMFKHAEFSDKYAQARLDQAQLLAEEIITIADTTEEGVIVTEGPKGVEIKRADMIEHRKLRVDARKWVASKLLPKKYGDRVALDAKVTDESDNPVRLKALLAIAIGPPEPASGLPDKDGD